MQHMYTSYVQHACIRHCALSIAVSEINIFICESDAPNHNSSLAYDSIRLFRMRQYYLYNRSKGLSHKFAVIKTYSEHTCGWRSSRHHVSQIIFFKVPQNNNMSCVDLCASAFTEIPATRMCTPLQRALNKIIIQN